MEKISYSEEELQHCNYAGTLVSSSVVSMVLNTVIELEVFEILAKAAGDELSASQIVSQMPHASKNPDAGAAMLDRMLSLLVGHSVLTCSINNDDGRKLYGLAPVAKYFVRDQDGESFGPVIALLNHKVFIQSWFELKNAVLEGGVPFERVYGMNAFEYASKDPKFNEVFNKAMNGHTNFVMSRVLELYKGFENVNTLVDVAGGLGVALIKIISKYPAMKGINFDLPHVLKDAPAYPGLEHVGGNMFERIPEGDAIFMKWILHDWCDDDCVKMLKNCHKALPENGKVIVVEAVLPVKPEKSASFVSTSQADLVMLSQLPGGKERTEKEFLALATRAGFKGMKMCCLAWNTWVMEFYK